MFHLFSDEVFDENLESRYLKNICQLTFPSMGFEKAGEIYFSPDGKSIIFQAVPQGKEHYQIFLMRLDEMTPRMVSTGEGACTCPYFSPDGNKIIFASSHRDPKLGSKDHLQSVPGYQRDKSQYLWEFTPYMNIFEANLDGTSLQQLTSGSPYHAECAYSNDGSSIVFASNMTGSMNLYTMNKDGSELFQVTNTTESYNGGPFFSPDGHQILFRSDREKKHYLQIYVIDRDGTNERQLTSNGVVNWAPYWHPNGNVIAYTTSLHGHAHYEIYLLNIWSGKECRLTHSSCFDGLPVFSNDGTKMMWTSKRGPDNTCQVFIADFLMPEELS